MLPTGRLPLAALIVLPLALSGCRQKEPQIDLSSFQDAFGGMADSFGDMADSFSDFEINDPPDAGLSDAEETDDAAVSDVADAQVDAEDVTPDVEPEPCEWQVVQTIEATEADTLFGANLVVDRNRIAIASNGNGPGASGAVAIYQSRADGPYTLEQRITPEAGFSDFGRGLALDGELLAVGAASARTVFVYEQDGGDFAEADRVVGPAAALDFAAELALRDGEIFVGAPRDGTGGPNAGAVYRVTESGDQWGDAVDFGVGATSGQFLGGELSVTDSLVVVGGDETVRVLDLSSGAAASLPAESAGFGAEVHATEDAIYVGADGGFSGAQLGSVVVFEREGADWVRSGSLLPELGAARITFGSSIAGGDDILVVGASTINDARGADEVLIYERDDNGDWVEAASLRRPESSGENSFGLRVGVHNGTVFVADAHTDTSGDGSGAVHVILCR